MFTSREAVIIDYKYIHNQSARRLFSKSLKKERDNMWFIFIFEGADLI